MTALMYYHEYTKGSAFLHSTNIYFKTQCRIDCQGLQFLLLLFSTHGGYSAVVRVVQIAVLTARGNSDEHSSGLVNANGLVRFLWTYRAVPRNLILYIETY